MSLIYVHKKSTIAETQHFLQGGITGGNVAKGVYGLVGLTLTFATPAGSVTFTDNGATDRDPYLLMYTDIKSQIEAAIATVKVVQFDGVIGFIEATPTTGLALAANNEQAKALLGFKKDAASSGKVYSASAASPPALVQVQVSTDNAHVLYTLE